MKSLFFAVTLLASSAWAQEFKLPPSLNGLASRASETVEVNLDQRMLKLASQFMDANTDEDRRTKQMVQNLRGVYVRTFEFEKPGSYNAADLQPMRNELQNSREWTRIVGVRSARDGEDVDIFVKLAGDHFDGIWIISTEPKELAIVNIQGPLDWNTLNSMGGQFGIPKVKKENSRTEASR
jgi:Domain of unknown function (DUF4252)